MARKIEKSRTLDYARKRQAGKMARKIERSGAFDYAQERISGKIARNQKDSGLTFTREKVISENGA